RLEIEHLALKKEKDAGSRERREAIGREIAQLQESLSGKKSQWQAAKDVIAAIRTANEAIEAAKVEEAAAERSGDLAKVAQIRYGTLNELQKKLEAENARLAEVQANGSFLSEDVTEEHISKIVSSWTG